MVAWVEVNERDGNKNTKQVLLLLFYPSHELAVFFRRTFKVHDGNVYVFVSFSRVWGACWRRNHRARLIQMSSIPAVAIKVILFKPRSRLFQCFWLYVRKFYSLFILFVIFFSSPALFLSCCLFFLSIKKSMTTIAVRRVGNHKQQLWNLTRKHTRKFVVGAFVIREMDTVLLGSLRLLAPPSSFFFLLRQLLPSINRSSW